MRRVILTCLAFFLMSALIAYPAFGQERTKEIEVQIDGLAVAFDVPPVIRNDRTFVPFRAIAEALNVKVSWDGNNRTISASDGKTSVWLQINNPIATRNQIPIELDAPPVIMGNRTLIPLRFFSEAFDCQVSWDGTQQRVKISSPPGPMTVIGFYALGDSKSSSWQDLFGMAYPGTARANTDIVSELALGWYSLDAAGNLLTRSTTGWQRPDGWEKVLEAANTYRLDTEMVVHLTNRDGVITSLLSNNTAVSSAASTITAEARQYQGVNLDLEGLGWQLEGEQLAAIRDSFTNFVRVLAGQLRAAGLNLTLTLHAPNSAYKGYDYQALGQIADRIIIMAYDYGSRPEPVSLVTQAVTMAREVVPPEKLILGISTPSETADSMRTKVGIAKRYNLAGIAIWRLGLVSNDMWLNLRSTIQPR